jgi:ABC-2 type transport system ATP-binding protein
VVYLWNVLELRALTKIFNRVPVVDRVSFSVRRGEACGYLGPNGSGKSTTVRMIVGLLEPTSGEVLFDGEDIRRDTLAFRRKLGYVPEEPDLYRHLSGREYLLLAGRLRQIPAPTLERRVEGLLELFGLGRNLHGLLGSYSKGMRQKVLLSAALLHDPDVLVFDEPLSGLDVTMTLVFRLLVARLAERGKVVLFSSHVLDAIEKTCSTVVILSQGRVVAHDTVARLKELRRSPSLEHVFTELAVAEDPGRTADAILEVMSSRRP